MTDDQLNLELEGDAQNGGKIVKYVGFGEIYLQGRMIRIAGFRNDTFLGVDN